MILITNNIIPATVYSAYYGERKIKRVSVFVKCNNKINITILISYCNKKRPI